MLTSIAAIAGAVTALIGVGYSVAAAIKNNAAKKKTQSLLTISAAIKAAKTDEERNALQESLDKLINS